MLQQIGFWLCANMRRVAISILMTVTLSLPAAVVIADEPKIEVRQYEGSEGVGILLGEGDNFGEVVAAHPENLVFYIEPSETDGHRGQKIIPSADGQKFIGLTTGNIPVLNGSVILKEKEDKRWEEYDSTVNGFHIVRISHYDPPPWYRIGVCQGCSNTKECMQNNYPCTFPQDLFITKGGDTSPTVCRRWKDLEDLETENAKDCSWYYNIGEHYVYVKMKSIDSITDLLENMNNGTVKVEISFTRFAFGYDEAVIHGAEKKSGIVIKNLVIEKYANPAETGAVGYYRPGSGWHVEKCEVRYNHGIGVRFAGAAVIKDNYLHHNGEFGIACGDGDPLSDPPGSKNTSSELSELNNSDKRNRGWADGYAGSGAQVLNNVVAKNALEAVGFAPGWGAGGSKFSMVSNLLIKGNRFIENHGPGIWLDFAEDNNIIEWNHCEGNEGPGIFVEISGSVRRNNEKLPEEIPADEVHPTLVRNNFCKSNGRYPYDSQPDPGGINLSSSNEVIVSDNIVISDGIDHGHGIMMIQIQDPAEGKYINRHVEYINVYSINNQVVNNDIVYTGNGGKSGANAYCFSEEDIYKVFKGEPGHEYDYPFVEPGYWVNINQIDDWDFFDNQNGNPSAGKPFQGNRYHYLESDSEKHWVWGCWSPPILTLDEFKCEQLEVFSPEPDDNIDPDYWFDKWISGAEPSPPIITDKLYGLQNIEKVSDDDDQYWISGGCVAARAAFTDEGPSLYTTVIQANLSHAPINIPALNVVGYGYEPDVTLYGRPAPNCVPGSVKGGELAIEPRKVFRWSLDSIWSSQPSANQDGVDHMLTYHVISGPNAGNYVMFWEDDTVNDYNDLVLEANGAVPVKQVNDKIHLDKFKKDCEPGPIYGPNGERYDGGICIITARFTNISDDSINGPFFGVEQISVGSKLLNGDDHGDFGGIGSIYTPVVDKNIWPPNHTLEVSFEIALGVKETLLFYDNNNPLVFYINIYEGINDGIIDNIDEGFSTVGSWTTSRAVPGYYGTNYRFSPKGSGEKQAKWSFPVKKGRYALSAKWAPYWNRASNARYLVYNNGVEIGEQLFDQRTGIIDKTTFAPFDHVYNVAAGTLDIVLTDNADNYVIADAVKVVFLGSDGNLAPDGEIMTDPPSIGGAVDITAGESVCFWGTGTDPDNDYPLTYLWEIPSFGESTDQRPGCVVFNTPDRYDVTYTVTDALGLADRTPAKVTVVVSEASNAP